MSPQSVKDWFRQHVRLDSQPYTLDLEQAQAVQDFHKNTLVTARAGSGKTRVIVAKVAYLVAKHALKLNQIKIFVFNRSAAAEVNQRLENVLIDNCPLSRSDQPIKVASTFHKFALDLVKLTDQQPKIIDESAQSHLINQLIKQELDKQQLQLTTAARVELTQLATNFITRAGQKFPGKTGFIQLHQRLNQYYHQYQQHPAYQTQIKLHHICHTIYQQYLKALPPLLDFNLLMDEAATLLKQQSPQIVNKVTDYQYILVDEYQDFSYLFFNLIKQLRCNCPSSHLFVVGDDWQAINRFAGSDCDYFLNFANYFPEDNCQIHLATNYRSDKRIVENANIFMLDHSQTYGKTSPTPQTARVQAFSRKKGRIKYLNPQKIRFDTHDIEEDALGDGRYEVIVRQYLANQNRPHQHIEPELFKLLKTLCKIIKHHRYNQQILLLHRHNFTSYSQLSLTDFQQILQLILANQHIMTADHYANQVRIMTMHKSKGLESDVVILLEMNHEQVLSSHPHANTFELFDDNPANERADQERLLYVALTRAKHYLYVLSNDAFPPTK